MAASSGTTLDAEILYMIAKALIRDLIPSQRDISLRSDALTTLRALRLTSREFASMVVIKKALFSSLDLHAREEEMDRVQRMNFSGIGPSVAKVTFFSSPFSAELKEHDYKKLLLAMSIHKESNKSEEQEDDATSKSSSLSSDPLRCHEDYHRHLTGMDDDWDGEVQNSRFDARILYEWYMLNARKDKDIVLSGRLQEIWCAALKECPNIVECKFASVVGRAGADAESPDSLHMPGCGAECIQEQVLRRITASSSLMVFHTIVKSIMASGIRIQNLSLERGFLTDRVSLGIRGRADWDRLDLSKLEKFTYVWTPNDKEVSRFYEETDAFYQGRGLASHDCEAVLAKAHGSVRNLILDHGNGQWLCGLKWPHLANLEFPSLQSITLKKVLLESSPFARDISRCPVLRRIVFNDCDLCEFDPTWKPILDAIRGHQNALLVVFRNITTAAWCGRLNMKCNTDFNVKWKPGERSEDDIEGNVYLYLTKQGGWNNTLEDHFPDR
ncbi:hypothetical protein H2200_004582 [Cladophialophora chaetospira]|uniref:Uncharacterized protein n=1 Tax=Cladophialophora chaetospira TaxID=386627 RepID=A0AA38XDD3_9EURO|nr:hypothetical protein H2200_004582 [Cladophialophora chaetospira]